MMGKIPSTKEQISNNIQIQISKKSPLPPLEEGGK
jgi:hypothetical protein